MRTINSLKEDLGIRTAVYPEAVDRNKVQDEWNLYAIKQNGHCGIQPIRWLEDEICMEESVAFCYLADQDRGGHDCLAVRFYASGQENSKVLKWLVKIEYDT